MILISKTQYLAAACLFQEPKNGTRAWLMGVHITPHIAGGVRLVATDGRRLLSIRDSGGHLPADFSPITVRLSSEALKAARLKKNADVCVEVRLQDDAARVCIGDSEFSAALLSAADYPDVDRVIPSADALDSARSENTPPAFDAHLLDSFLSAAKLLSPANLSPIRIRHGAEGKPTMIEFPFSGEALGVIMPLRV